MTPAESAALDHTAEEMDAMESCAEESHASQDAYGAWLATELARTQAFRSAFRQTLSGRLQIERAVTDGQACVECSIWFVTGEQSFPLFHAKPHGRHWGDHRARCLACAKKAHVVDALRAS